MLNLLTGIPIELLIVVLAILVLILVFRQEARDRKIGNQLTRIRGYNEGSIEKNQGVIDELRSQISSYARDAGMSKKANEELQQRLAQIEQDLAEMRGRLQDIGGDRQMVLSAITELKIMLQHLESCARRDDAQKP